MNCNYYLVFNAPDRGPKTAMLTGTGAVVIKGKTYREAIMAYAEKYLNIDPNMGLPAMPVSVMKLDPAEVREFYVRCGEFKPIDHIEVSDGDGDE